MSSKQGIMIIKDDETLDLSMTLITGMKAKNSLIVAADGLAGFDIYGLEHLGKKYTKTAQKLYPVSNRIIVGYAGSKINWSQRFVSGLSEFAVINPNITVKDFALLIPPYVNFLYSDRFNDPEFFLSVFVAGYSPEQDIPEMYLVHNGDVSSWGDDHPWMTVGHGDLESDDYIKKRHIGKLMSAKKTREILLGAIGVVSEKYPECVGGHNSLFEVTKSGVTKLQ